MEAWTKEMRDAYSGAGMGARGQNSQAPFLNPKALPDR